MANGLHSFVFREIRELLALGVDVHIFPTKVGTGPYLPDRQWPVHRMSLSRVLRGNILMFIRDPGVYFGLLREATSYRAWLDFVFGAGVAPYVITHDIDLIHCHFGDHKLFIGYFCSRLTGRPLSVTIHAYEIYNNPNPRLFRRVLAYLPRILTISQYNREKIAALWNVPPEKVTVSPLFTELPKITTGIGRDDSAVVLLMVARFVEKKGHRVLFEAVRKLPENVKLWLVGRGPLDVRSMARDAGIADRVRFLGQVSDQELEKAYRSASIFCLPSEVSSDGDQEGIPVALMEAMAHGLPVVASRHAGIPELVEDNLMAEGDVEGLVACLSRLASNPELRATQGKRNREIVSARYSGRNVLLLRALFEAFVDDTAEAHDI